MSKKKVPRAPAKPLHRERIQPNRVTGYLNIWWSLQKPYCGYFSDEREARFQGMSRDPVIVKIQGTGPIGIDKVVDHWRRDNSGNPIPAEWQTPKPKAISETEHAYFGVWWHLHKPYAGLFSKEREANLQAMSRNGVVAGIIGEDIYIESVEDYKWKDELDNPLQAEWLTARFYIV